MWFCVFGNKNYGPFSEEETRQFIAEHPDSLVWQKGMPEWMPASMFGQLSDKMQNLPRKTLKTDLDFKICGNDMQYVEIALRPNETIIAEPGSMIYKQFSVDFEALLGSGKKQNIFGKLFGAGKRAITGESFFITAFTNTDPSVKKRVAFAAPYPGKILPISLGDFGNEIICQRDSFLCAQSGTEIGVFFQKRIMTAFFGGAGFIMQRLTGSGMVFITGGGSVYEYDLNPGESVQVDAGCLVAFEPSVLFTVSDAGTLKAQFFGGAGLFFADLTGPGKVWIQSLPFSRLAQRIAVTAGTKKRA